MRADSPHDTVLPIVLSILGAVCGTLVTNALASSPTLNLVGAAIGASLPPLIGVAGSYWHLRAGVGVVITVVALLVTYGGFSIFDAAQGTPGSTFPSPSGPDASATGPSTAGAVEEVEGNLGISVSPSPIHCTATGCPVITVRSTGVDPLHITDVAIENDPSGALQVDRACVDEWLQQQGACAFTLTRTGIPLASDLQTRLVVHQNFVGPATFVPLLVDSSGSAPVIDLVPSRSGVSCTYSPSEAAGGPGEVTLFFQVDSTPAPSSTGDIGYDVAVNGGPPDSRTLHVAESGALAGTFTATVSPVDAGAMWTLLIVVDPNNDVAESDESNNALTVTMVLPGSTTPPGPVPLNCVAA